MKKKKKSKNPRRVLLKGRTAPAYSFEFKLKVVRLHLEEGYKAALLAQELGISDYSVYRWTKLYREYGEQGLRPKSKRAASGSSIPKAVQDKIIALKQQNPTHGPRRISDVLKRFFLVKTSPSTIHRTLSKTGMTAKARKKPV